MVKFDNCILTLNPGFTQSKIEKAKYLTFKFKLYILWDKTWMYPQSPPYYDKHERIFIDSWSTFKVKKKKILSSWNGWDSGEK